MTVRVGVIGTGWWATRAHLPALAAHHDAEITAIADPDAENRERALASFAIGRAFADADEMLAAVELDAAIVAVPHVHHAPLTRACLAHRLHVLLEKPMTIAAADAFDLVQRARDAGRQLIIGYPWHYGAQAIALREAILGGRIGRLEAVSCLYASTVRELYRGRPEPYRDVLGYPVNAPGAGTYSDPDVSGGGQGQTQVTHVAALLGFLTGLVPVEVAAFTERQELEVDLVDAVAIRFEGGAVGTLASTGSLAAGREEILEIRVFGTEGHVLFDVATGRAEIVPAESHIERLAVPGIEDRYPEAAPATNLVEVALGRASNGSPAELGAATVAFIEAMYAAAASGRAEVIARDPHTHGRHERGGHR